MGLGSRIWGHTKNYVSTRTADIGDHIANKALRFGNGIMSTGSAVNSYRHLLQSTKTFYGKEIVDEHITVNDLRQMNMLARHLQRYTEERLSNIAVRYQDNPTRLEHLMNKIVGEFTNDLGKFINSYNQFLSTVNDELVKKAEEVYQQDDYVQQVLIAINTAVSKGIHIPKDVINNARKEVQRLARTQQRNIGRELRDDAKVHPDDNSTTKKIKFFTGITFIGHQAKKNVKRFEKNSFRDFQENLQRLNQDIEYGSVNMVTLSRLILHMKNLHHSLRLLARLHHDVRKFISIGEKDFHSVQSSTAIFLAIFKASERVQHSSLNKELENLNKLHDEVKKILDTDVLDDKKLSQQLKNIQRASSDLFMRMSTSSDRLIKDIKSNPGQYIHSGKLAA
jgi:hypothetical protein